MLYRFTLMFRSIDFYDSIYNQLQCLNENIPAPKHVFGPVIGTLILSTHNLLKLSIYNNSIISTIALSTPKGNTDRIRVYMWFFTLNLHKSKQIQHDTFAY
jgi:hypothetical protein